MDPGSGGREQLTGNVTSYGLSFCHIPHLAAPSIRFAAERPHGSGHERLSPGVERSSGVCVLTFCAYLTGPEQVSDMQGDLSNSHRPILAVKGVVSRAPESRCGSSGGSSFTSRLTQTARLSSPAPELPHAAPSCVATVQ